MRDAAATRAYVMERYWELRRTRPAWFLLHKAKARANRAGMRFELVESDIHIPKRCPVLGIPLVWRPRAGTVHDDSPSVDRISNRRGYTRDNIRVISWRANRLKNDATLVEMRRVVAYMENPRGRLRS